MAADKASRKMNVQREKTVCLFEDAETMQFKTPLHPYFHVFTYLT